MKKIIQNLNFFVNDISKIIIDSERIKNFSQFNKRQIFAHFLKSQQLIKIFFIVHLFLLNTLSFLISFKSLKNLSFSKREKLYKLFEKYNFIKFKKITELITALVFLIKYNNEKLTNERKSSTFQNKKHYDNIVIGSGPGGAVTVNNLLKNKFQTLLIEQGYKTSIPKTKHPATEFYHKWKYSGLSGAVGKYDLQFASAECYGGGSEINSGLYHEIDNLFIKKLIDKNGVKNLIKYNDEWKSISSSDNFEELNQRDKNLTNYFKDGSKTLGWKYENIKKFFKKNGSAVKQSMTSTLLSEAENSGLELLLGHKVKKIFKSKDKWILTFFKSSKEISCKNLFLCCGTPYTLNLLKNSGILPWTYNDNFHFHPMIKIVAKFPLKVNHKINENVISSQITEFYPNYLFGNAASDIQFLKISAIGNKIFSSDVDKNSEHMAILHSTFTNGKCDFIKIPFLEEPIIVFKINRDEVLTVKEGLFNLIKFAFKSGADYVYILDESKTKLENFDEKDIKNILEKIKLSFSAVHLLGGINFGEKKENFFNSYGECKIAKYKNLFINDSSLISENLLKNPQGAIMSIAKRNIDHFIKEQKNVQ